MAGQKRTDDAVGLAKARSEALREEEEHSGTRKRGGRKKKRECGGVKDNPNGFPAAAVARPIARAASAAERRRNALLRVLVLQLWRFVAFSPRCSGGGVVGDVFWAASVKKSGQRVFD